MVEILVIDDEEPIRKLLARIIELEGYKVSTASCCSDALQQLRKQQFDVILCDVFLPDGNGVDFIFDIKRFENNQSPAFPTSLVLERLDGLCHYHSSQFT